MNEFGTRFIPSLALVGALMLLCSSSGATAQVADAGDAQDSSQAETPAGMPVQVDLDHASFAYEEGVSLVEMYLAFEAATLRYTRDTLGFRASLPVRLDVVRSTQTNLEGTPDEPVWQDELDLSFILADTTGLREGQHFVQQVRAAIPPGEYELQVQIPDRPETGQRGVSLRRDMLVPDYGEDDVVDVSDITLASSITQGDDRNDPFFKNGLLIRPNANQLFGSGLNRLFYYAEVYNLDRMQPESERYTAFAYLAEANIPQPLPDLQRRSERQVRAPDVLVGSFDVSALPSGSYFLRIAVLNANNEAVTEQSRKFFVYNPDVAREQPVARAEESFETSQYAAMTEEEVERMVEHIGVIMTETERRRVRGIQDLDEKRRFLMDFWQKRDPQPTTPINEYQDEFYSLVQYANDRYTTNMTEGWNTDRGRTLIRYGAPTAIEPHLFDRGFEPYEIWEYNNIPGEGRAQFIFADISGFGSFELIHSTVAGERKLANWQAELRK
ncbi:MAG: GWxTD domain-containing protein [Rhodothermales bacterium]|nr:GWxTD domain-containing protein [Rhodothermales bacterium]